MSSAGHRFALWEFVEPVPSHDWGLPSVRERSALPEGEHEEE